MQSNAVPNRYSIPDGPIPMLRDETDSGERQDPPGSLPCPPGCKHETDSCCRWTSYPCSLFEDWTYQEVQLTGLSSIMQYPPCEIRSGTIHQFDVMNRGKISALEKYSNNLWSTLQQQRPKDVRLRVLCLENLNGEALRMVGSTYRIYPSVLLSFLNTGLISYEKVTQGDAVFQGFVLRLPFPQHIRPSDEFVDTQSRLRLGSDLSIGLEVLPIYVTANTIISWSSSADLPRRILFACTSIYWRPKFSGPVKGIKGYSEFIVFIFCWFVVCAWDELMQSLQIHTAALEKKVIEKPNQDHLRDLRSLHTHLSNYHLLLDDFIFAANGVEVEDPIARNEQSRVLHEISRLENSRAILISRVTDLINIVFNDANSRLTQATVRDSKAMKQISYLTVAFLPGSFVASVFGITMNQLDPDTALVRFVMSTILLTAVTAWILLAFQWTGLQWLWAGLRNLLTIISSYWRHSDENKVGDPEALNAREKRDP